jgi:hypothetical protein
MGPARTASLVVLLLLACGGGALAQETQSLSFLDAGKPAGSIPVSRYLDGGKTPVATTNTDGTVSIPIDALGFGKGETVVVWVRRCEDGRIAEVILTSTNEDNPCPSDGEVGEACGCEKVGTFVVGDGPATFDLGRPSMLQRIGYGGGIDFYNWLNFEDVSGNQPGVIGHDASSTSIGGQLFAELPCRRWPLSVGLEASYTQLDTETQYSAGTQTGDITYLSVGPYMRIGPNTGKIRPYGYLSALFAWNMGDFTFDGQTEERTHDTWRGGIGGGLLYQLRPGFHLRADGMYSTTLKDNDADEHIRWKLGLMFLPGVM